MNRRFYRELWMIRFQKMLDLEKTSAQDYGLLLRESKKMYKDHPIQPHLETLIRDEKKHAKLVRELIHILNRQPE